MSMRSKTQFPGVYQAINPSDKRQEPEELEVTDDLEGEQETMLETTQQDDDGDTRMSDLRDTLLQASKGVTEGTDSKYQRWDVFIPFVSALELRNLQNWCRLMKQCESFLVSHGFIEENESFFASKPSQDAPWCIASWIMNQ
jgi:hypothetical protein